ncbi:hypothetical protein [Desulfopila inferna]|uniref:hypothetical protein n=1 Tax=Desulfopila inferna TaxID=468528 RepID=UPI001964AF76|nr:hypothetical protein [Desulfopila inferna]MBM9604666.1 hypothetical protein [Desulfopila inferna]
MKKIIAVCFLAGCVTFASNGFATSDAQKPLPETQQKAEQTKELVYTGIVKKHKDGAALITPEKVYPLLGGDFVTIIGQEVRITGSIVKEDDVEKLVVSSLQTKQQ